MDLKRGIWLAVVLYVLSFVIGLVVASVYGVDLSQEETVPNEVWYPSIVLTIILTAYFTLLYFKKVPASASNGFQFGILLVAVGFILDAFLIVPLIILSEAPSDIGAYYANPLFWLSIAALIATAAITGYVKEHMHKPARRVAPAAPKPIRKVAAKPVRVVKKPAKKVVARKAPAKRSRKAPKKTARKAVKKTKKKKKKKR